MPSPRVSACPLPAARGPGLSGSASGLGFPRAEMVTWFTVAARMLQVPLRWGAQDKMTPETLPSTSTPQSSSTRAEIGWIVAELRACVRVGGGGGIDQHVTLYFGKHSWWRWNINGRIISWKLYRCYMEHVNRPNLRGNWKGNNYTTRVLNH